MQTVAIVTMYRRGLRMPLPPLLLLPLLRQVLLTGMHVRDALPEAGLQQCCELRRSSTYCCCNCLGKSKQMLPAFGLTICAWIP